MTRRYARSAEKRLRDLAGEAATQFDATVLHNRVHEQVAGQHDRNSHLLRLLDLAERSYDLADDRRQVGELSPIFGAAEQLNDQVDELVAEQVATACHVVISESDDWDDAWDSAALADARHEARNWLQTHPDAAQRAGVWQAVTGRA